MEKKDSSSSQIIVACPECEGTRLTKFYEEAGSVCMDCGFVATSNIANHTAERNSGGKGREKLNACDGESPITCTPKSGVTDLHVNHRVENRLLEVWRRTVRVSDQTEKNLAYAFSEITKIGSILSLPKNVLEKAATTYKILVEKRCVRGRSMQTLSTAAVYLACKQCGCPRTLNEVAIASKISKRKVWRSYSFLVKELGCFIPPIKADQYLKKLLNQTAISEKTKQIADKILGVANELKLTSGRNPIGIVAASYYIASLLTGERKTQREIAEITRVTEATIRNRYKELVERLLFTLVV